MEEAARVAQARGEGHSSGWEERLLESQGGWAASVESPGERGCLRYLQKDQPVCSHFGSYKGELLAVRFELWFPGSVGKRGGRRREGERTADGYRVQLGKRNNF